MPDIGLQVTVSRTLLALPDLDINDHQAYYVAPGTLGAQLSYNRQQISAPWCDGQITVNRSMQNVSEPVVVEVLGEDNGEVFANMATLLAAFAQDHFTLTVVVDGLVTNTYRCEAADYQIGAWVSGRLAAEQAQVTFTVPRQPLAKAGVG